MDHLELVTLYSDLNTKSTTILTPAPTEIIANNAGKLAEIVVVMIETNSCIDIVSRAWGQARPRKRGEPRTRPAGD